MIRHTPLPWGIYIPSLPARTPNDRPGIEGNLHGKLMGFGTTSIVLFGSGDDMRDDGGVHGETLKEANANAEFIVRAVNCHYELLDALKKVTDYADDCASDREEYPLCIESARAAIAKAEGGDE